MVHRYEPEDVRRELLYLRKGQGFTADRLERAPAIRSVLGGSNAPYEMLRERFESAVLSLRDDDSVLLMAVFGLTLPTQGMHSVAMRRDHIGAELGIGREAVADRDAAAIERLLVQLLTGWYPKSPTGVRIPESHNGFVQHSMSITTLVRNRRHQESRHHYRLVALFDGVQYLAMSAVRPEPPIVAGEDFTVRTNDIAKGYVHQFWHTTPMQRGQTYDLRFLIRNPDPDEPYLLTEESLALHEPTRFAVFEVIFQGDRPTTIWEFSGLTALERPGAPSKDQLLDFEGAPSVRAEFNDLYGGLYTGIAWDW